MIKELRRVFLTEIHCLLVKVDRPLCFAGINKTQPSLNPVRWALIEGGESEFDVACLRAVIRDLKSEGVRVYVKTIGAAHEDGRRIKAGWDGGLINAWPEDLRVRENFEMSALPKERVEPRIYTGEIFEAAKPVRKKRGGKGRAEGKRT